MAGDFSIITRSGTGPTLIEMRGTFEDAVLRAKEIASLNKAVCFVYCSKDGMWKYRADPPVEDC